MYIVYWRCIIYYTNIFTLLFCSFSLQYILSYGKDTSIIGYIRTMSGKLKVLALLGIFSWNLLVSDYIHRNSTFWPVWYSAGLSPNFHYKCHIQQRRDVGKYSFANWTIKSSNQLPASLLASFPCKINTFRKRVKNVVTGKGIEVGIECK